MGYSMKITIINGPNLNLLGIREKEIYGEKDYDYLISLIEKEAEELKIDVTVRQSNHEGEIIDWIQATKQDNTDGLIINPGAYTHYSYAIRDALASISIPKIEVHISNIHKREAFRQECVTTSECDGQFVGLGLEGYLYALRFLGVTESA